MKETNNNESLWNYTKDLEAKIRFLIDYMDLPEKEFTFPDGDTWLQTGKWEEINLGEKK